MKKTVLMLIAVAVVGVGIQNARAGDREWALAGKVLTGVAAAAVISHAVASQPAYYPAPAYNYNYAPAPTAYYAAPPAPVYVAQPAPVYYVVQPAPVVVYRPPVCLAPTPVVSFRYAVGGGYRHYRRGCW